MTGAKGFLERSVTGKFDLQELVKGKALYVIANYSNGVTHQDTPTNLGFYVTEGILLVRTRTFSILILLPLTSSWLHQYNQASSAAASGTRIFIRSITAGCLQPLPRS